METTERIRTVELAAHAGERVCVAGWLHARRRLGGLTFLTLRDGWGIAQIVAEGEAAAQLDAGLSVESVLRIEGTVTPSEQAPGGLELTAPNVEVIAPALEPPPVAINKRELKAGHCHAARSRPSPLTGTPRGAPSSAWPPPL